MQGITRGRKVRQRHSLAMRRHLNVDSYDSIHLKNVRRTKNDFELRKKMKNAIPGPNPRKK